MDADRDDLEEVFMKQDLERQQMIIAGKTEREEEEERKLAEEKEQQEIEADRQKRQDAEAVFRDRLRVDFLLANDFGTQEDFERLYDRMRDLIMIENLRERRK